MKFWFDIYKKLVIHENEWLSLIHISFAKVAVDGIRKEIEAAGFELALLEKYTDKAQLLDAVKDANAIIIRSDIIDAEVLDAAKELKIVVLSLIHI